MILEFFDPQPRALPQGLATKVRKQRSARLVSSRWLADAFSWRFWNSPWCKKLPPQVYPCPRLCKATSSTSEAYGERLLWSVVEIRWYRTHTQYFRRPSPRESWCPNLCHRFQSWKSWTFQSEDFWIEGSGTPKLFDSARVLPETFSSEPTQDDSSPCGTWDNSCWWRATLRCNLDMHRSNYFACLLG